jgi:hypothetical protein
MNLIFSCNSKTKSSVTNINSSNVQNSTACWTDTNFVYVNEVTQMNLTDPTVSSVCPVLNFNVSTTVPSYYAYNPSGSPSRNCVFDHNQKIVYLVNNAQNTPSYAPLRSVSQYLSFCDDDFKNLMGNSQQQIIVSKEKTLSTTSTERMNSYSNPTEIPSLPYWAFGGSSTTIPTEPQNTNTVLPIEPKVISDFQLDDSYKNLCQKNQNNILNYASGLCEGLLGKNSTDLQSCIDQCSQAHNN